MQRPTHTEHDYTAEYLGCRTHEGSGNSRKKKKSSERRGRKSKKGRTIRLFRVNLLPTEQQELYLESDLEFFNEIYSYTMSKLSEAMFKDTEGFYHGYDVKNSRKTIVKRRSRNLVPHTPRFLMNSQNKLIKEHDWMQGCTYQVSYRATVQAFQDKTSRDPDMSVFKNGDTYEAKICYRIVNGFLYLKKFDQFIQIKETLPPGGLEAIRITKGESGWTAVVEILEPYDKAQDVRESRRGVLETDTSSVLLGVTPEQDEFLERKSQTFNVIANHIVIGTDRTTSLMEKMQYYQEAYEGHPSDIGLLNMACVAGNARLHKYRNQAMAPLISKNYISLSEGFYIKDKTLHLKRWGIELPLLKGSLRGVDFDYIVIRKNKDGLWLLTGKRRKRKIFRNLSRVVREFSWKDKMIF